MGAPEINSTDAHDDGVPSRGEIIAAKYRVERVVGVGGMGVVLAAEHLQLGQTVAIKVLSSTAASNPQAIARFLREARAAAGLRTDHVVRTYDVGTLDSGLPFIVMELLHGSDLGALLDVHHRLPIGTAVDYVLQACDAIAEAHRSGIVHRDLKPSNLFVTRRSDGTALLKVLDFGISKALVESVAPLNLTATHAIMGSPLYMSPEQVRDARKVDTRTDIWSLGVILHELLCGAPAFRGDTLPSVCASIAADPPTSVRELRPEVPEELEAVVLRCLEKDPARRFQSVEDLVRTLAPFGERGVMLSVQAFGGGSIRTSPLYAQSPTISYDELQSQQLAQSTPAITAPEPAITAAAVTSSPPRADAGTLPERKKRMLAAALVMLLLTVFIGASIYAQRARRMALVANHGATATRPNFTLTLDSVPQGAGVYEGSTLLGRTPLALKLENASFSRGARTFTLKQQGFEQYSLAQAASQEDLRIVAALVHKELQPAGSAFVSAKQSEAPHSVISTSSGAHSRSSHRATVRGSASAESPNPNIEKLDIRMQR